MSTDHEDPTASPRPGSFASLEVRVARLERQYDEQSKVVGTMAIDVAVSRAKIESMDANLSGLASTVGKAMEVIQASIADSAATPAGRAIQAAIAERDKESDETHKELSDAIKEVAGQHTATRLTVARWGGAIAVLSIIINICAPIVLRALHLI